MQSVIILVETDCKGTENTNKFSSFLADSLKFYDVINIDREHFNKPFYQMFHGPYKT